MSQASPEKLRRDALGILAAAIAAQLAVSTAQQGLPALGPILASTFDLTTSGVGLLLGTISLGTAGAVIFWGNLADRIDDRLVALIGLLGTATCFVIAAFFKASEVAHFALIFAGIMMASPTVAMTKGLARNFVHLGNIGFALSTRQAAVPVGGVIGGIVLTGIAVSHGLSAALYALAALIILGGLFVMFRSSWSSRTTTPKSGKSTTSELAQAFTDLDCCCIFLSDSIRNRCATNSLLEW
jgi:MFS family permease